MEGSNGYTVGGVRFPAYPVDKEMLKAIFAPATIDLMIRRITSARPVREGYSGMLLLTARRR